MIIDISTFLDEEDLEPIEDIVDLRPTRKVLFKTELKVNTATLPRRKPYVSDDLSE